MFELFTHNIYTLSESVTDSQRGFVSFLKADYFRVSWIVPVVSNFSPLYSTLSIILVGLYSTCSAIAYVVLLHTVVGEKCLAINQLTEWRIISSVVLHVIAKSLSICLYWEKIPNVQYDGINNMDYSSISWTYFFKKILSTKINSQFMKSQNLFFFFC